MAPFVPCHEELSLTADRGLWASRPSLAPAKFSIAIRNRKVSIADCAAATDTVAELDTANGGLM
jgi:hypothetical protein